MPVAPCFPADRFHVARCETARPESALCHELVGAARVPSTLKPGENSLRLPRAETDKITDVVKHSRRDQNQAIEAIQQSAMTRNQFRSVFQAQVALNRRQH